MNDNLSFSFFDRAYLEERVSFQEIEDFGLDAREYVRKSSHIAQLQRGG